MDEYKFFFFCVRALKVTYTYMSKEPCVYHLLSKISDIGDLEYWYLFSEVWKICVCRSMNI